MAEPLYRANVLVCSGTGCTASKSPAVFDALTQEIQRRELQDEVRLVQTGCRGFCAMGPIVIVYPEGIFHCGVQAGDVPATYADVDDLMQDVGFKPATPITWPITQNRIVTLVSGQPLLQ